MNARVMKGVLALALAVSVLPVHAGDGHGHGDELPAAAAQGPRRLPDGSVYLPKPAQRQLAVRTFAAVRAEMPRVFELNGKVVMDPNAGGKVQSIVAGRVTPGPKGLPYAGQAVSKGQVLAYVTPEVGGNSRSLNETRLRRLRELSETVPRKLIEEAEAAVANEELKAPVSGVIASAGVVAGQVVEARETLFEIVNPERFLIEALSFDPSIVPGISGASLAVDGKTQSLRLIGAARSLREQALPLVFKGQGGALSSLALGQPVRVQVRTRQIIAGIPVPAQALMKNPANQTVVWVKTAPERFEPRVVTFEAQDGVSVAVLSGLAEGELVVSRAAGLVNQVR